MKNPHRWILLSLILMLTLASCKPSVTLDQSTPDIAPTSASTAMPTATPTAAPATTWTPAAVPTSTPEPTLTPVATGDDVVLTWQREGGIAGFCDEVVVYADGTARVASCGEPVVETALSGEVLEQVSSWVERLQPFEWEQSDDAVADAMTVRMAFAGRGAQSASDDEVQAMLDLAASLVSPRAPTTESAALETVVRYVLANDDVTMYAGPGTGHDPIGQVFGGQIALVTGVSADGAWWRVICPDDTVGDCWMPADPRLTQPTTPPGAWPVHMLASGVSVEYPDGWTSEPGVWDEVQQSVWLRPIDGDAQPVGLEVYQRPLADRHIADPYTWQPNEGGYRVHWARPIATAQGLSGTQFVWGAYLEGEKAWETPPTLMVIYYDEEDELDIRLTSQFDQPALDLWQTAGFTETVAARFGILTRMAQSVRVHPTTGWATYRDVEADGLFEVKHPAEWAVRGGGIECGAVYEIDSLRLITFEGCWADVAGGKRLTFFETLQHFREAFGGEVGASDRDVNGMHVQVVHYGTTGKNGILALEDGPGTVAVWQVGERGFALVDPGNRHQADGVYDGMLGSFTLLPPFPRSTQPLDGRPAGDGRVAFDLPGIEGTISVPEGYGMILNNEYNRRGSFVSYDFTPYGGDTPRLAEIQLFSEASIQTFHDRCTTGFCFEGDYPDVERYRAQRAALAECVDLPPYRAMQFDGRCYLVTDHVCMGDACVIREYATFLGETQVVVWVTMRDASQARASDALFASLRLAEE